MAQCINKKNQHSPTNLCVICNQLVLDLPPHPNCAQKAMHGHPYFLVKTLLGEGHLRKFLKKREGKGGKETSVRLVAVMSPIYPTALCRIGGLPLRKTAWPWLNYVLHTAKLQVPARCCLCSSHLPTGGPCHLDTINHYVWILRTYREARTKNRQGLDVKMAVNGASPHDQKPGRDVLASV